MLSILILGATGRTGSLVLKQLERHENIKVSVALRQEIDISRLPNLDYDIQPIIVDINSIPSLNNALIDIDIVVNAIRLREDILPTALVELHKRIVEAANPYTIPSIITVGGAGSLHPEVGKRFWQYTSFPTRTLPRGIAHAKLRDYFEGLKENNWAYLIPPPSYISEGIRTGHYDQSLSSTNENEHLNRSISYADFAIAVCDAIENHWTGTYLIGNKI